MSYKRFLISYALISLSVVALIAGINCYIDIYGLFRGKKNRNVYINERTTKYLFSLRYTPENFEGFIAGPSLSANLNPEAFKDYKIYNTSVMGINISELNVLVDNIIERGHMKFAIICMTPYLTKNHEKKGASIDRKEYYGALGSTNLLRTYLIYFVRKYNIAPFRYAKDTYNACGWDNFELEMHNLDARDSIESRAARREFDTTYVDPVAYHELGNMLEKIRRKNIKIIAYYTPVPYKLYQLNKTNYEIYKKRTDSLFKPGDIFLDLNDDQYKDVNSDYNTFIDHGHLSGRGQAFVEHILDSTLHQHIKPDKR